jgi:hypothetical protein
MTIEWLAGNRLRGTTAERPNFGLPSGSVGGWVELGRTTLGSAGDNVDVTNFADKRYLMYLGSMLPSGTIQTRIRQNSDTGSNYAHRYSLNGASDGTGTSQTGIFMHNVDAAVPNFSVGYAANLSGKEKLNITHYVGQSTAGAGTSPLRSEHTWKHVQTSNPINDINYYNAQTGSFASGSEVVVLGWDPADTHTTNFWEELASVDLSGGVSDTLSSGTFTAKKYLWVQCYLKSNVATPTSKIRVGNNTVDSGTNYAERYSVDGGTDGTVGSIDELDAGVNIDAGESEFHNMFIINNASNEKLMIHHRVGNNSGTGAGTAPNRRENVFKWANTSNQINILQFKADSGTYATNSILKVWGAD